jgi:hypothetical protein
MAVWAVSLAAPLAAQEARTAGHVLLLPSERGMEGDIEKIGDQYRVRRGASEVWLPAAKAVVLCADWDDAYAFMKKRANLGDPDERLRLSRWCQLNNLRGHALTEAKAALDMRPAHEETRRLVALLTRSAEAAAANPSKNVLPQARTPAAAAPPKADVSADAFAVFATRIQPILMNTCVQCHGGGRGGAFHLIHTESGQRASTQANLAAVLEQVNLANPPMSPLLIKAVSRHGNANGAPIKDRQAVPFKALQAWIDYLLANNPHLRQEPLADATKTAPEPVAFAQAQPNLTLHARPTVISRPAPRTEVPQDNSASLSEARRLDGPKTTPPPRVQTTPAQPTDAVQQPQPNALDPFDPAIFNRQALLRK